LASVTLHEEVTADLRMAKEMFDLSIDWDATAPDEDGGRVYFQDNSLYPEERGITDRAYHGDARFIARPKELPGFKLPVEYVEFGCMIDLYRGRGEHIMHEMQLIPALRVPFRGTVLLFAAIVDISVHMVALKLRVRHNERGRRYRDCIGPWPHWDGAPVSTLPVYTL